MRALETPREARVVIIDNYDSFVFNLFQAIGELTGRRAKVFRNDQVSVDAVAEERPTHLLLSPGPGNPEHEASFGICGELIRTLGRTTPLLGVCLGHQGIGVAFGGRVVRAPAPLHGKTSLIAHDGSRLYRGCPSPLQVMHYHSLMLDPSSLPAELRPTAWTADGILMGLEHARFPLFGTQFHPESIGTPAGHRLLSNFLEVGPPSE